MTVNVFADIHKLQSFKSPSKSHDHLFPLWGLFFIKTHVLCLKVSRTCSELIEKTTFFLWGFPVWFGSPEATETRRAPRAFRLLAASDIPDGVSSLHWRPASGQLEPAATRSHSSACRHAARWAGETNTSLFMKSAGSDAPQRNFIAPLKGSRSSTTEKEVGMTSDFIFKGRS